MNETWIKIDIATTSQGVEPLTAVILELGIGGVQVQDANDIEELLAGKAAYWDYCDDNVLALREAATVVTVYLPENPQGAETLLALESGLNRLKRLDTENEWGELTISRKGVREEDWAENWKKYYHAAKIGERLVVCPAWEQYDPIDADEIVVLIEPGMAFGTGTHETTRLCMRLLEQFEPEGKAVLDLGCGSGILAVSAMLLGAKSALGVDIDETAVRVAKENAALNGAACEFRRGGIPGIEGKYGVVFANIVADVIIGHIGFIADYLDEDGVFIASGIIDTREAEVVSAIEGAGLRVVKRETDGGWVAIASSKYSCTPKT
jgi:ribosomal protein L11 methyltransferase